MNDLQNQAVEHTFHKHQTFRLEEKERGYFMESLAVLLSSGLSVSECLNVLCRDNRSRKLKRIINQIAEDVDAGVSLWQALHDTSAFPANEVSLIQLGEKSGRLASNMDIIVAQQEKERDFRSKLQSAMLYPILVFTLATIIGLLMAWFILPRLASVFNQLNIDLPLITRMLIRFGEFLKQYGYIAIPFFILIFFLSLYLVFFNSRTRFIGQWMMFQFGPVRQLIQHVEMSRFGFILGSLLKAGVPIIDALDALTNATLFRSYHKFYSHLRMNINEGESFDQTFQQTRHIERLFPMSVQRMISTAEQSGHLSDSLLKISERHESKVDTMTKNVTVLLEPLLLIIVWLGVVLIALAVILPIYSLIGELN